MKTLLFLSLSFFLSAALATPAQVILIRHAEKPLTGPHLNERGYQRAQALVSFFETDPQMTQFGVPVAIYAMSPKADGDSSVRAIETMTPLAKSLNLQLHTEYTKKKIDALAKDILSNPAYEGHMVLVCWEHNMIPLIAQALGAKTAPSDWDGSLVFDRAWVIDFKDGKAASFQDLPQHILPGDSTH